MYNSSKLKLILFRSIPGFNFAHVFWGDFPKRLLLALNGNRSVGDQMPKLMKTKWKGCDRQGEEESGPILAWERVLAMVQVWQDKLSEKCPKIGLRPNVVQGFTPVVLHRTTSSSALSESVKCNRPMSMLNTLWVIRNEAKQPGEGEKEPWLRWLATEGSSTF